MPQTSHAVLPDHGEMAKRKDVRCVYPFCIIDFLFGCFKYISHIITVKCEETEKSGGDATAQQKVRLSVNLPGRVRCLQMLCTDGDLLQSSFWGLFIRWLPMRPRRISDRFIEQKNICRYFRQMFR